MFSSSRGRLGPAAWTSLTWHKNTFVFFIYCFSFTGRSSSLFFFFFLSTQQLISVSFISPHSTTDWTDADAKKQNLLFTRTKHAALRAAGFTSFFFFLSLFDNQHCHTMKQAFTHNHQHLKAIWSRQLTSDTSFWCRTKRKHTRIPQNVIPAGEVTNVTA